MFGESRHNNWKLPPVVPWTSGTTSPVVPLPVNYPIVGLYIHLNVAATLTFTSSPTESGTFHDVLKADGTQLIIDATSFVDSYRFYTEFGPARFLKVVADAAQATATIQVTAGA